MSGLSLSCGHHHRQTRRLYFGQRQELTQGQKMELRQEHVRESTGRYNEFLSFVSTAHNIKMTPSATCPKCSQSLMIAEIVLGFKTDVNDYTTECPRCKQRFEPTNLLSFQTGKEVGFWCNPQTRERLPGKEMLELADFEKQHPEIYYSAIFWFGSLLNAFKAIGVEYRREKFDIESKARTCLGQISDKDVAAIFGISVYRVSQMRSNLRIPPYGGKGSIIPANWQMSLTA